MDKLKSNNNSQYDFQNTFNQIVPANWKSEKKKFYIKLLIPSVAILTLITFLPILYLITTSFTSWDLSRPGSLQFINIQNYIKLITDDDRFYNSLFVQLKLTLFTVPAQVILGLFFAVYIKENIHHPWFIELARGIFIIPMVIPPIVAGLIWKIMFTPPVSILNYFITQFGFEPLAWLGDPSKALMAISVAAVWELFPFCFLLLYAGLMSIPEEPLEAASVDGASGWQTFWYVTLPMLRPTLSIVIFFRLVDSIRAFPLVYVMTDGGPGTVTEPTNYYAFQKAFNYSYVGYSSAMIVVVLAFTMLMTWLMMRSIKWQSRPNEQG
jgi:multiple sugar transport system permease protein